MCDPATHAHASVELLGSPSRTQVGVVWKPVNWSWCVCLNAEQTVTIDMSELSPSGSVCGGWLV